MRRPKDAEAVFYNTLENDPENVQAHYGLAQVLFRLKEYEKSAEHSLNAVGLLYHFPKAHMLLGIALAKLGIYERSIEAFEVSLRMAPGLIAAHKYLSYIYLVKLNKKESANHHIEAIKRIRERSKIKV